MISLSLSQAAEVLHGDLHGQDLTIDAVTTDTRKVTAGCLFVALKGERFELSEVLNAFATRVCAGIAEVEAARAGYLAAKDNALRALLKEGADNGDDN